MANGDVWQVVNTSYLNIRGTASVYGNIVGQLSRNDKITETGRETASNGILWIGFNRGWCATESLGVTYLNKIKSGSSSSTTTITQNTSPPSSSSSSNSSSSSSSSTSNEPSYVFDENVGEGYQPDVNTVLHTVNNNISNSEFVKFKNVAGVFGLPYQFLPNTDIRLSGDTTTENIGFEYAERIVERVPLLFLCPGKANFMTKYSKKNKEDVLSAAIAMQAGLAIGSLEDLLTTDGRYFTFEADRTRYYEFVNPMCRIAARYLNLQDVEINGEKLDNMNWMNYANGGISLFGDFGEFGGVPFYVDTDTSVNESFSNSTTQSMLASTINSVSDLGKELNFLLGYTPSALGLDTIVDTDVANNVEVVENLLKGLGKNSFLKNLTNHFATIASGGRLTFPEIWNDSSFSRSYNLEFKFISPDPSTLSVYLNVLVPLFHLICLVAPQCIEANPNAYMNPFLVRGVYKGFFNIDMGIITDMTINKGGECQWTPDGIPTSVMVTISIKDLYQAMSITATSATNFKYDTLNNTALMDYIANLCGINIFRPEIGRIIDMWFTNNFTNRANDLFPKIWSSISDKVSTFIMNLFR